METGVSAETGCARGIGGGNRMIREAIAIAFGLAMLAVVAFAGVHAAGLGTTFHPSTTPSASLVCSDYCPIGAAHTAAPGL